MVELDRAEALRLLGSVPVGRIVFTQHALPAIRPVNHLLAEDGTVVIRTHDDSALTVAARQAGHDGMVVAYEADVLDPETQLGWSVVVTGYARLVTDRAALADYSDRLHPWIDRAMGQTLRIVPELVHGFRLTTAVGPEYPATAGGAAPDGLQAAESAERVPTAPGPLDGRPPAGTAPGGGAAGAGEGTGAAGGAAIRRAGD